jgi:RHS repeat-associated protein
MLYFLPKVILRWWLGLVILCLLPGYSWAQTTGISGDTNPCPGVTTSYSAILDYNCQRGSNFYYGWNVSGGRITAGGGQYDNYATVVWSTSGTISLSSAATIQGNRVSCGYASMSIRVKSISSSVAGVAVGPAAAVCPQTSFNLSYQGSTNVTSVDWYKVTPAFGQYPARERFLNTSISASNNFSITVAEGIVSTTQFVAKPSTGCSSLNSSSVLVAIKQSTLGRVQASQSPACASTNLTMSYPGSAGTSSVSWAQRTSGTTAWQLVGTNSDPSTNFSLNLTGGITQTTEFSARPNYCGSVVPRYEAEEAQVDPNLITTVWPGYSGIGFVGYLNVTNRAITFTVKVPAAGYYTLNERYAAANQGQMGLYVNSTSQRTSSVVFPATGAWDKWATHATKVALQAGDNTIMYRVDTGDSGSVNLDYLEAKFYLYEAEDAKVDDPICITSIYPGYSGTGFVGYLNIENRSVTFTVSVPTDGAYAADLRYAVGGSSPRTMSIFVNGGGQRVQQATFPSTGAWDKWAIQSTVLSLKAGTNTIQYSYKPYQGDNGGINPDYLQINPTLTATVETINNQAVAGQAYGSRTVTAGTNSGTVQLVDYGGTILGWQYQKAGGTTWQDIATAKEELAFENLLETTQYRAAVTSCAGTFYSIPCTIQVSGEMLNWAEAAAFKMDGSTLVAASRTYVDGFGKSIQSQNKNLSQGKILATQPLYGKYDQAVGSTLPAPITANEFTYLPNFITPASAPKAAYDYSRFDDETRLNSPEAVSNTNAGTLGWYYSINNNTPGERYTAVTDYPYSRSDAMPDGSTGVSRAAGPGVGQQVGSTHETVQGTFSVRTELDEYAAIRGRLLPAAAVGEQVTTLQGAAVQRLQTDADGNTTLVFADKEGHPVMSARPATADDAWTTVSNVVELGWPYSAQAMYSGVPMQFTALTDIMVYDSQGNWIVTGTPDAVAAAISTRPTNQRYTFYSTDPLTVSDGTTSVIAQVREAYPFFNFYIAGNGTASLNSLSNTTNSVCRLFNTITGAEITLPTIPNAQLALPVGCYQLRLEKGAVQLTYTGAYKDISFNFYNQKGQVVESVAPKGVKELLASWRSVGPTGFPYSPATVHPFSSTFEYDQQGRQLAITETDAGRTVFVYRTDGKLRLSQNALQFRTGAFSYLGYDLIGRAVEAGECVPNDGNTAFASLSTSSSFLESIADGGSGLPGNLVRRDIVRTTYDMTDPVRTTAEAPNTDHNLASAGYSPNFLPGRVATVTKYASGSGNAGYTRASQTWFSYDEQGRTQWQVQQTEGQAARTIEYAYDAAGNTQTVCYQKNVPAERLTHYYSYNADNRLSTVSTTKNDPATPAATDTYHAVYSYYLTGGLKRVAYGVDVASGKALQGVDYTYTATGQLKAINDGDLQQDPGQDALGTSTTQYADFFATSLHYYPNDYASAAVPVLTTRIASGTTDYKPHYNGLVSGIAWQTPGSPLHAYGYNYDDKGQLLKADHGLLTIDPSIGRQYTFALDGGRYGESLPFDTNLPAYDANGNINRLTRTDGAGWSTLNGLYDYLPGTNKLNAVLNQAAPTATPLVRYSYDAIGQVVSQKENDLSKDKYLEYDASGKVTALYANADRNQVIARYTYDEFGKRLIQKVYPVPADARTYTTTTFVRDVAGNELASYVAVTTAGTTAPAQLYEQPIYGATRLGILRQARDQTPTEQLYELNDQLGNTRVVFRKPTTVTYALSMEDARVSQEKQDFPGPAATTYDAVRSTSYYYATSPYNASSGTHYSMRLLNDAIGKSQSPTKRIAAQRGDKLHLTAYVLYNNTGVGLNRVSSPAPANKLALGLAAGVFVGTSPRVGPMVETTRPAPNGWQRSLSQVSVGVSVPVLTQALKQSTSAQVTARTTGSNGPAPAASLQYIIYKASDNTPVRNGNGIVRILDNGTVDWQALTLDVTIKEDYPVFVDVFATNQDASIAAYFDDLTVQYTPGPVIEENHFYAYGQRNEGLSWQRNDERLYGRGYQGQNTTQDAESGYTAFDLRMYDSRYGRWMATDPYRQYSSPYAGMGNNPINGIDSDGGFFQELRNWVQGNGWISNAGANFIAQTPGATYNGWVGSKFTGHASVGYPGADGNPVETGFKAIQDLPFFNLHQIEGIPVFETRGYKPGDGYGAVTLPPFGIFSSHVEPAMIHHEYGHWLQYRSDGSPSAFYLYHGLPSIYNEIENTFEGRYYGAEHLSVPHDYYRTETDANSRSALYFKSQLEPQKYHLTPKISQYGSITRGLIYGIHAATGTQPSGTHYK